MERAPTEYELALRAREGDREALAELVERTRLRLFAQAYAELRHYEDAQDAVAAALLQVCRHVREVREPGSIHAWMRSIVRNEVRRLRGRADAELTPLQEAELQAEPPAPSLLRLDIERALRDLPGEQARAIRLFYLADLSTAEIARRTGRSEGTIRSWLHRGRRHLATQMEGYAPMRGTRPAAIVHTDLDTALLRKVREALRSAGYNPKVLKTQDLAPLVEELKEYLFIVVDEWIAGRPALELLLHLKADGRTSHAPICMLCTEPSDFTVSACWVAGVDRLVDKNNAQDVARLNEVFRDLTTVPEGLPVIPVRDKVYFPNMAFPLFAGREKTLRAIQEAQAASRKVLLLAQKEITVDSPGPEDLYQVGVAAKVTETFRLPDGTIRIMVEGIARARVVEYLQTDPLFRVRVEVLTEEEDRSPEAQALIRRVTAQVQRLVDAGQKLLLPALSSVKYVDEAGRFADSLVGRSPTDALNLAFQQEILETIVPRERLEKLSATLS